MDELKTFVKVAIQRTIKPNQVSLIAEENILNVVKGRVLKIITLKTFKCMDWPYTVLVTVTKKGNVIVNPVVRIDRHIELEGSRLDLVTEKKGVKHIKNYLI